MLSSFSGQTRSTRGPLPFSDWASLLTACGPRVMLQHLAGNGGFRGFLDFSETVFLQRDDPEADLARLAPAARAANSPAGFFSGWVGFFGYEWLCRHHGVSCRAPRDIDAVPDGLFARPQTVFTVSGGAIFIESAQPGRAEYWHGRLAQPHPGPTTARAGARPSGHAVNCDFSAYAGLFEAAKEAIRDGETYQIKLSIRHRSPAPEPARAFARLLETNPAPESFFLRWDDFALLSCSPETVIDLRGRTLATRPIGGTFPRGPETDALDPAALQAAFAANPKETSEHNMLIDLERNDLNRVCQPGSVQITHLREVETYAHVHHLVTRIAGELSPGVTRSDILRALLPGGSITGCPKRRTIELIDQWEPSFRGPYTGSFGVLEDNGDMHLNLIIRTLLIQGSMAYVQAGGGIVVDSDPHYEYRENLLKGQALLDLLPGESGGPAPAGLP